MKVLKKSLFALALAGFTLSASAADRALLIGVGEYQNPKANLPGIDLDIMNMRQVARIMGYKNKNIRTLENQQATAAGIERAIKNFIIEGTDENDRVMIYYSGHGSRIADDNGDEEDNADEVLVAHDVKKVRRNGKLSLENIIRDDDLSKWLSEIRSKDISVYIDACNSGTATRSISHNANGLGETQSFAKFFNYDGMPVGSGDSFEAKNFTFNKREQSWLGFSAAQDNEFARASNKGSYFTLGMQHYLNKALANNEKINHKKLERKVKGYIASKLKGSGQVHTPKLTGSYDLKQKTIRLVSPNAKGAIWNRLVKAANRAESMNVSANRAQLRLGDVVNFSINIPADGYLNVISVDAKDQATVLYPNAFHRDNHVSAGRLSLPTAKMNFDIQAQEPLGRSLTVAFVTTQPINLYKQSTEGRDQVGRVVDALVPLSAAGTRALGVVAKSNMSYAGKVVVNVSR